MSVTDDSREKSRGVVPRAPAGPYEVDVRRLVDESLQTVLAQSDIADQVRELTKIPLDLTNAVERQWDVIQLNIAGSLEQARQLGHRLNELLAAEAATDPHLQGRYLQLIEAAIQLRDASEALRELALHPSEGRADTEQIRTVLDTARKRYFVADSLLAEEKMGKGAALALPPWPANPRTALDSEYAEVIGRLERIENQIRDELRKQRDRARVKLEFRALETEWNASLAHLSAAAESIIESLVRTELNQLTTAHYATRMRIGSLKGLREAISSGKVIVTASFRRLESAISQRDGGSFGVSGPRGVGKTTLIDYVTKLTTPLRASEITSLDPPPRPRLGINVSAPVAYEPRDFLLYLHSRICRAVLGPDADREPDSPWEDQSQRNSNRIAALYIALAGAVMLTVGTVLLATAGPLLTAPRHWWSYLGLVLTSISAILLTLFLIGTAQMSTRRTAPYPPDLSRMQIQFVDLMERTRSASRASTYCLALAFCAAAGLPLIILSGGMGAGTWWLLGGVVLAIIGLALLFAGWTRVHLQGRSVQGPADMLAMQPISEIGALREAARDQLRKIHTQQTLSTERSMVVKLGGARQVPLGLDVGAKQGMTLAERPKSYPEIVADLRSFIESVAKQQDLVIAIDELDKMKSAEQVENFLNDIKAVFGSSRCFFLVSVSEEAAASFERRGVPFRDVFDSAFDDVVTLDRLPLSEAKDILHGLLLDWTEPFVALCYVLSGGLPRELHRSVRNMVGDRGEGSDVHLDETVPELMRREAAGRLWAVRHSLQRGTFEPAGLSLLNQLEGIQPQDATAAQFEQWYGEFRSWATRDGLTAPQLNGTPQLCAAARLGCEIAGFMLFAATLIDFFDSTLDSSRLSMAEGPTAGDRSLTHLAEARHALSTNPWSATASVARFRRAWGM